MSQTTIDGKEVDEKLLEELNKVIKTNNDITSKQNDLMLKYTKGLWWLTIVISIVALLQLITMFIR